MTATAESGTLRVPRSINGIEQALTYEERARFYDELGPVEDPADREAVITTWWLRAMSAAYGGDRSGFRAAVAQVLATGRAQQAGAAA
ncbi:hypothetical protein AB0O31_15340 [Kitasatospora cineracea]|jgi:hypothetical protein|uniref:Uncharacterized protein n=1 Tax=Kitasatospora cineracea TaxID=88074 RepID=A0A3N4RHB9_9ACTN|nr:hypothetical protein [Kitasatospora cineracea]ROR35669.1 hypothetical protein EDD39_7330 [Kitasatospora cineracea]RPE27757.1 hypothetical protein EDD38_7045 [Kitasatospora cineracea]